MNAVLLGTWAPGTAEWHAARQHGLGGSEIAAVLGLSPFESRFSLWHRKAGAVGPVEETPEMYWGKVLEPVIIAEFERRHPEWIVHPTGTWRPLDMDRVWQVGNPDSLLFRPGNPNAEYPHVGGADAVLETKLSMFGDGWGDDGSDQVPPHVRCQCIWYGDVLGVDTAHVCVFIAGGLDIRTYTLTWDQAEAELLRDAAREFLASIEAGNRPDIDEHTATYQVIKEMHPEIDGTDADLTDDTAVGYIAAKLAEKTAVARARQATAVVADEMGNAQRARWQGQTIATRRARDGGTPYVVAARGLTDGEHVDIDRALAGVAAAPWVDPETGDTF